MSVPASPENPREGAGVVTPNRRAETNRANARKSTGPRTPEGKARSAMNALKHGASARIPLLPGDDPAERDAFVGEIIDDLAPADAVERDLAERIAGLSWRRRRLWRAERQMVDVYFESLDDGSDANPEPLNEYDGQIFLAKQFESDRPGSMGRLSDYERRLTGSIDASLRMLLKLQDRRAKREAGEQDEDSVRHAPAQNEAKPSGRSAENALGTVDADAAPVPTSNAPVQDKPSAPVADDDDVAPVQNEANGTPATSDEVAAAQNEPISDVIERVVGPKVSPDGTRPPRG